MFIVVKYAKRIVNIAICCQQQMQIFILFIEFDGTFYCIVAINFFEICFLQFSLIVKNVVLLNLMHVKRICISSVVWQCNGFKEKIVLLFICVFQIDMTF